MFHQAPSLTMAGHQESIVNFVMSFWWQHHLGIIIHIQAHNISAEIFEKEAWQVVAPWCINNYDSIKILYLEEKNNCTDKYCHYDYTYILLFWMFVGLKLP